MAQVEELTEPLVTLDGLHGKETSRLLVEISFEESILPLYSEASVKAKTDTKQSQITSIFFILINIKR
jgi:hypothetical protein